MMFQCRLTDCKKCTTLIGDVVVMEVMLVLGQEVYGKPLFLPFNFTINLKLLLKTKYFLKLVFTIINKSLPHLKYNRKSESQIMQSIDYLVSMQGCLPF